MEGDSNKEYNFTVCVCVGVYVPTHEGMNFLTFQSHVTVST